MEFAEACTSHFTEVAKEWKIMGKVAMMGTDSALNMIVAAVHPPFEHLPCAAHIIQRLIRVALHDKRFAGTLAICCKLLGHFRHNPAKIAELKSQQSSHGQAEELLVQDVPTLWNSMLEMKRGSNATKIH